MFKIQQLLPSTALPFFTGFSLFGFGFAILVIQILGIKILAPYVGATMPIWGSVISVTLIAGMFGYYGGGVLADKKPNKKIFLFFCLLAGLAIIAIPECRGILAFLVDDTSYIQGAFLGSVLFFLFPTTLLSALITYIIRIYIREMVTVGQVHGDLYALATFGSIAGVFVTSYLLVPYFTISSILYVVGMSIIILGIVAQRVVVESRTP